MIVDVHCHLGFSGRALVKGAERFSFEPNGAEGHPGFDAYASTRLVRSVPFQIIRRKLGVDPASAPGESLDADLERIYGRHFAAGHGVDALVLLAFDEYRDSSGRSHGPSNSFRRLGTDTYTSNTLVREYCRQAPHRFLFGASIHPYRRDALPALDEVAHAGAALIKWLPVHHNIDARDPRTVAFLRRAGELSMPMLIHYGGELSTANQHPDQMNPRPLLRMLSEWPARAPMPTIIVAHAATPSMPWQHGAYFKILMEALAGEFRNQPIYTDISAMSNRPYWLWSLAKGRRWKDVQGKLVFGSDFPIPPLVLPGMRLENSAGLDSWIGKSLAVSRKYGFDESVFHCGGEILKDRIEIWQRIQREKNGVDSK